MINTSYNIYSNHILVSPDFLERLYESLKSKIAGLFQVVRLLAVTHPVNA